MTDLTNINIEKSLELLKTKKISSKELVEFYLKEAESEIVVDRKFFTDVIAKLILWKTALN